MPIQFVKSGNLYTINYFEGCLTATNDVGYTEYLIPYFIGNKSGYKIYYGMSVIIDFGLTTRIQIPDHISIKYFAGVERDSLSLVFRAEYAEKHLNLEHAQPHWHFHFSEGNNSLETFETMETFSEESTFDSQPQNPMKNLAGVHFPYCWDKKRKASELKHQMTSVNEIKDWLEFTTTYVWSQLSFIYR